MVQVRERERRPYAPKRPRKQRGLAELCHALREETRLEIVRALLAANRGLSVQVLSNQLKVPQPTLSHHLRILQWAGVVVLNRRAGSRRYYCVDVGVLKSMATQIQELYSKKESVLDALLGGDHVG